MEHNQEWSAPETKLSQKPYQSDGRVARLSLVSLFKVKEFCSLYHGQQIIMMKNTY